MTKAGSTSRVSEVAVTSPVTLKPLDIREATVDIVGVTELITHRWDDKAKKMMLDKQMGVPRPRKEPKRPEECYEASMYRLPDGRYGFPAVAFKAAIAGACRQFDGLPMTLAKIAIHVLGEGPEQLVPIEGTPHPREDMVRLEKGVADIRYRAGFWPWRATLRVRYNANVLTPESLVALIDAGGMGGVGEWRPSAPKSATGTYGMFRVAREGR